MCMWELAELDQDPFVNLRIGMKVSQSASIIENGLILMAVDWIAKL